jgi:hypothetical protein
MFRPVFIALLLAALLVLCASWTGSISTKLLLDHSTYDRLNPLPSAVDTNFLTGLSKASVHTLSNEIDVIDLSASVDLESVSKRHVFVRTGCYPLLLGVIRESQRTVLIGNPGTSKSFLHYYYLARLCNPSLLGPLPRTGKCELLPINCNQADWTRVDDDLRLGREDRRQNKGRRCKAV